VPTLLEFKKQLCLISVSQFLHVKSTTSYNQDSGELLADFLEKRPTASFEMPITFLASESRPLMVESEVASLHYVAGYG